MKFNEHSGLNLDAGFMHLNNGSSGVFVYRLADGSLCWSNADLSVRNDATFLASFRDISDRISKEGLYFLALSPTGDFAGLTEIPSQFRNPQVEDLFFRTSNINYADLDKKVLTVPVIHPKLGAVVFRGRTKDAKGSFGFHTRESVFHLFDRSAQRGFVVFPERINPNNFEITNNTALVLQEVDRQYTRAILRPYMVVRASSQIGTDFSY